MVFEGGEGVLGGWVRFCVLGSRLLYSDSAGRSTAIGAASQAVPVGAAPALLSTLRACPDRGKERVREGEPVTSTLLAILVTKTLLVILVSILKRIPNW